MNSSSEHCERANRDDIPMEFVILAAVDDWSQEGKEKGREKEEDGKKKDRKQVRTAFCLGKAPPSLTAPGSTPF